MQNFRPQTKVNSHFTHTEDKTVKLWKISEREKKVADDSWNINGEQFVYSSSNGSVRLCDMRDRALCDTHAKSGPIGSSNPQLYFAVRHPETPPNYDEENDNLIVHISEYFKNSEPWKTVNITDWPSNEQCVTSPGKVFVEFRAVNTNMKDQLRSGCPRKVD
ncbi:hypothetical protein KIN20_023864 [Parelaphostrongylus tenuis]|uniref:Uncharacterized protein n=1 Tax=Parelaphostrongylus tenuis TaxID=148309 RepID=A0AAD5N9H8_PARTN|nr:hypothetical protein KIN20_023864 [Parelaphostrongylus tenuis]